MGAWIEIILCEYTKVDDRVAPHDGCVDWNKVVAFFVTDLLRRTPRWVRGLKLQLPLHTCQRSIVAPHDGCVDWNYQRKINGV